jgi:hypothetical protein
VFDGTNVGIGTSSPSYKLDISSGEQRIASPTNWNFGQLNLVRSSTNTSQPRFFGMMLDGDSNSSTTIGDYNAIWGMYNASPTTGSTSASLQGAMVYGAYYGHRWYINGSEQMRIDSSGNVGIGTATINNQLSVYGGVTNPTISTLGVGSMALTSLPSAFGVTGRLFFGTQPSSVGMFASIAGNYDTYSTGSGGSILFGTSPGTGTSGILERMRINSSGNVGIGTSSPNTKLTVSSATQYVGMEVSNGTYSVAQMIGSSATNDGGLLQALSAGTATARISGSSTFPSYFTASNVGIGTSSPYSILDVSSETLASTLNATQNNTSMLFRTDSNTDRLVFKATRFAAGSDWTYANLTLGREIANTVGNYPRITFGNNTAGSFDPMLELSVGSALLRMTYGGNVGIGTSSPAVSLDVNGAIRINNAASFQWYGSSANTNQKFWDTYSDNSAGNTLYFRAVNDAYSAANSWLAVGRSGYTIDYVAFSTASGSERMRIDSSGNVGIGAVPGTNANNIQPLTVYSQGPSNLTIKQGTSSAPKTASNSPLIWAQNYIKYDTPGDPFAQNVGGVFADVEVVNDATAGTQINGTWNAIIGNSVNNGINWGTSTSQNWSTKGSAIGVTGFARANGFPGDSQIITGLWGYPQGPTLDATTYANLPSGANWSLCGVEVNIQINHPDIGEKSLLVGQGSSVGALLSNYRTAGTGVKDWTFGVAYVGSPDDGNYSSTNVDNWNGFYCGILLDKIKAKGIRFGQYFKTGSYGIYFPDSYAGTQEPAAAIYMGNSKINMGQYTGSSTNNQDLWHNGGQLFWKYGGLTFPLMQMASPYTATVTALAGYILVKDDAGNYRKVAVMT